MRAKPANSNQCHLSAARRGKVLNITFDYEGAPVLTSGLIGEYREMQRECRSNPDAPTWIVIRSAVEGAFCKGGDIDHYLKCIRGHDREALSAYAHTHVDMLTDHLEGMGCNTLTIGLVDGDAFGGGLEVLLGLDFVIASETSRFGFPEVKHGAFPGLGALSLLARKVGCQVADDLVKGGMLYSASDMQDIGIVTHCVPADEMEAAAAEIIEQYSGMESDLTSLRDEMLNACPLDHDEMRDLVEEWTDVAMNLSDRDLQEIADMTRDERSVAGEV